MAAAIGRIGPLVTPGQIEPRLGRADWRLVDCRFDLTDPAWGRRQYLQEHLPGAVYAHLEQDLSGPPDGSNGRHPLPSDRRLAATFSRLGIDSQVWVVGYDSSCGAYAARLWWLLRYAGHRRAAVLDGGLPAWQRAGLPTDSGVTQVEPRAFHPILDPSLQVDAAAVLRSLQDPGVRLLDARAPERFRGEQEPFDPVAGRIAGARNRFWKDNLDSEGLFRPAGELKAAFLELLAGLDPSRAISYCGSGVTAAHNLLAMAVAGLPLARMYGGSWSEWCADPSRPTAQGPVPEG